MRLRALAAIARGASLCLAAAADPADRLADPAQEARARALFRDVRCLVCQNESIDDSEAELAARPAPAWSASRSQAGRSDAEIKRFLVDRYGEFVLLTPRVLARQRRRCGSARSWWSLLGARRCSSARAAEPTGATRNSAPRRGRAREALSRNRCRLTRLRPQSRLKRRSQADRKVT